MKKENEGNNKRLREIIKEMREIIKAKQECGSAQYKLYSDSTGK